MVYARVFRLMSADPPPYAELQISSNFSFLRGASHPEELAVTAAALGLVAFARYSVPSAWCSLRGAWCLLARWPVPLARCTLYGARFWVAAARSTVIGARCTVHDTYGSLLPVD